MHDISIEMQYKLIYQLLLRCQTRVMYGSMVIYASNMLWVISLYTICNELVWTADVHIKHGGKMDFDSDNAGNWLAIYLQRHFSNHYLHRPRGMADKMAGTAVYGIRKSDKSL